jgi:hypothetical protein
VKFNDYKVREQIRGQSGQLRGTSFWINEQFPKEINDRRKDLIPIMKEARQKSQTVRLVKDKLFINGKLYVSDTPTVGEDH